MTKHALIAPSRFHPAHYRDLDFYDADQDRRWEEVAGDMYGTPLPERAKTFLPTGHAARVTTPYQAASGCPAARGLLPDLEGHE